METSALYRVQREDLPRLQKMLTECFAEDPLYHTLIPCLLYTSHGDRL